MEDYLGSREYWKTKVSTRRRNPCNPFASKKSKQEINKALYSKSIRSENINYVYNQENNECYYTMTVKYNGFSVNIKYDLNKGELTIHNLKKHRDQIQDELQKIFEEIFDDGIKANERELLNQYYNTFVLSGDEIKDIIENDTLLPIMKGGRKTRKRRHRKTKKQRKNGKTRTRK